MSEKPKIGFEKRDWAAILLAALFVIAPLAIHPAQKLIEGNRDTAYDQGQEPWHFYEYATLGILIFQAWIYHKQRLLMEKQTELSEEQFIATHRPRLKTRNFWIDLEKANPQTGGFHGQFHLINVGGNDAQIIEGFLMVDWRVGKLPMKRPYEGENPTFDFPLGTFKKGRSDPIVFRDHHVVQHRSITDGTVGEPIHTVMGYVDYLDALGRRYRTAFCRTYSREAERFMRVDNDDYEHEE